MMVTYLSLIRFRASIFLPLHLTQQVVRGTQRWNIFFTLKSLFFPVSFPLSKQGFFPCFKSYSFSYIFDSCTQSMLSKQSLRPNGAMETVTKTMTVKILEQHFISIISIIKETYTIVIRAISM